MQIIAASDVLGKGREQLWFGFGSISARIAVVAAILIILFCAGLGLVAYTSGANAPQGQVEEALEMQAIQASEYLEARFQVQLSVLEALASRPELASMDWSVQEPILHAEAARSQQFFGLGGGR